MIIARDRAGRSVAQWARLLAMLAVLANLLHWAQPGGPAPTDRDRALAALGYDAADLCASGPAEPGGLKHALCRHCLAGGCHAAPAMPPARLAVLLPIAAALSHDAPPRAPPTAIFATRRPPPRGPPATV